MSRAHARLGPSDADRWMLCPGSIALTASMGERKSTIWSAEGSFAHQIREDCLELGLDADDLIGHRFAIDGFIFEWTQADANYLQPGIDRIRQFGGTMVTEYRVNLDRWMPGNFGTLDCGLIRPDRIMINDLKWGQGVLVEAPGNRQQRIYALGFWWNVARHQTDATDFTIVIDQPRAKPQRREMNDNEFVNLDEEEDEFDEPVGPNEWHITLDELLEFGREVKKAAKATEDPDAPRIPGAKQCRWCPAARVEGKCPEYEKAHLDSLGITFLNLDEAVDLGIDIEMPKVITPERRSALIRSWDGIKRWYQRMHANALLDALAGEYDRVPGLKAVEGRHGKRKFSDPDLAEVVLERGEWIDPETGEVFEWAPLSPDQLFHKMLISPAQVEKLIGKGKLPDALVERGRPKPVLVSANDPKPALTDRKIEFENLDDDENED